MNQKTTRENIVDIANRLFYQKGYTQTTFTDIAEEVGISRGNFYHHFKTKEAILSAVIGQRLADTQVMLDAWQAEGENAGERILCFIRILIMNRAKIQLYGCPVGTLTTELAKLDHPALSDANRVFTLFKNWLARQFTELGYSEEAEQLAMHLLARSQGVATVASAFHDETFIIQEVDALKHWLSSYT